MASLAPQQLGFSSLFSSSLFSYKTNSLFSFKRYTLENKRRGKAVVCAVAITGNAEVRERERLREMFQDAFERCHVSPMEGVSFSLDEFHNALHNYDYNSEIGTKVKGTVFYIDNRGALVDIAAKSLAFLPLKEACIYNIRHVEDIGICPGFKEEFIIIDENKNDDTLILSLRETQSDLAWERCSQLQAEDVVVKAKVVGANKGGVVAMVEGLSGFIPFSQISTKVTAEELLEKELPVKVIEVDEDQTRLVLSNRKAVAETKAQLVIGSIVIGIVQTLQPFGAFIDIGGMNGLLHISQISHDRVSDIATVLQPGDTVKVMVLSHDKSKGKISLSTKKLEPTPGDMIRNPKLVFEKAEEMAQTFRQRIAQAEAMARSDMLRFQPESGLTLNADGILGPLMNDSPAEGLDFRDIPLAKD